MKRLAMLLCLLVACKGPERIVRVEIPIAVPCPEPPILIWPDFPIHHVTATTPNGEVAKAWVASFYSALARLAEAYALLNGYRTATPKTTIPGVAHEP